MDHPPLGLRPIITSRLSAANVRPMRTPVSHTYVALALHLGGRLRIEHHGEFEVRSGHLHLVPAGDPHRALSGSRPEALALGFCRTCLDPSRFDDLLAPLDRVRRGAAPIVEVPADRQEYLLGLFRELERELHAAATMPVVAESLLALVLAEVVRAAGTMPLMAPNGSSVVEEALAVIEARCLGPLSLQEVAKAVGRTPAHVTTTVKRATGRTVVEWILEGRLAEARRRLLETDEYVDVIAERVGYADATHFIRLFRRRHGMTPAAFRAKRGEGG